MTLCGRLCGTKPIGNAETYTASDTTRADELSGNTDGLKQDDTGAGQTCVLTNVYSGPRCEFISSMQ